MKKLFFFAALFVVMHTLRAQQRQLCVVLDFQVGENVEEEVVDYVSYEFRSTFHPSCYFVVPHDRVEMKIKELFPPDSPPSQTPVPKPHNNGLPTPKPKLPTSQTSQSPVEKKGQKSLTKEQIRRLGRDMTANIVVYGTLNESMDEYILDVLVMDVSTGTTKQNENSRFQKTEYRAKTRRVSEGLAIKLCGSTSHESVEKGYTDLGLSSGTIWKNYNEPGFYTYDEAVNKFGKRQPTKRQWEELEAECTWEWTGRGEYKITGPNGNSITLPATSFRTCDGGVITEDSFGVYWSSTPKGSEDAWYLGFKGEVNIHFDSRCYELSIRLVQN